MKWNRETVLWSSLLPPRAAWSPQRQKAPKQNHHYLITIIMQFNAINVMILLRSRTSALFRPSARIAATEKTVLKEIYINNVLLSFYICTLHTQSSPTASAGLIDARQNTCRKRWTTTVCPTVTNWLSAQLCTDWLSTLATADQRGAMRCNAAVPHHEQQQQHLHNTMECNFNFHKL